MSARRPSWLASGLLQGLVVAVVAGAALVLWLGVARALMLWHYWPTSGGDALWSELHLALLMGLRFDAKVCASAAVLLFPWLGWSWRWGRVLLRTLATTVAIMAVVNFYYYDFYKLPIDAVIFGLFDDDTVNVLRTIWLDFPLAKITIVLALAIYTANALVAWASLRVWHFFQVHTIQHAHVISLPLLLVVMLLLAKGTLKASPLDLDNTSATSRPFLNSVIPNGVSALYNAWKTYSHSAHIGDVDHGLKSLGFQRIQDVAQALGIQAQTPEEIQRALWQPGRVDAQRKNLVFVQMESWSAEPLKYQSPTLDVMAGLAQQLPQSWFFDNFDSVQNGTHPALEAILFNSPVTPVTSGKYRHVVLDWGIAHTFKKAGYDTLFVTSGPAAWRELNQVLMRQGFDEVLDAASLRVQFANADGGVWGVWDAYMFQAIEARLRQQPKDKPLFVYAMSTTNHPPYELPNDYVPFKFDARHWPGDNSSEHLVPNLQTYRYANDALAQFVKSVQEGDASARTVIAATGDHNARSFGQYLSPERQVMRYQVPFVVWGGGALACPRVTHQAASHLDMFPTLFPLVGIHRDDWFIGRNLADCATAANPNHAVSVTFMGQARSAQAMWQLGNPQSLTCQPLGSACQWSAAQDTLARARVALMDWNVRYHIHQNLGKK